MVLSFFLIAGYIFLNVLTIRRQNKLRKALSDPVMRNHFKNKFSSWIFMVEDLKDLDKQVGRNKQLKMLRQVSLFIETIINLRDIVIGMVVVFLQSSSKGQVWIILIMQVSTTIILLTMNPYKDIIFSIFLFAKEVFYTATLIVLLIVTYAPADMTEMERRDKFSSPLLITIGGIILSGLIQLIVNIFVDGYTIAHSVCRRRKVNPKGESALKNQMKKGSIRRRMQRAKKLTK